MEKTILGTEERKTLWHQFYCDVCGKHLGTSRESDDGRYKKYGLFESKVDFDARMYKITLHLCPQCRDKTKEKIAKGIMALGFKPMFK